MKKAKSLDQYIDEQLGTVGTPKRDEFEVELATEIEKENKSIWSVKFVVTPDPHFQAFLFEYPKELTDVDLIDGVFFDDNGIILPKNIQHGIYSADLYLKPSYNSFFSENDDGPEFELINIKELITQPLLLKNEHQRAKQLEARIKELEPQAGYIEVSGNGGGNIVKIAKLDDNRIHLIIGDCCVYMADVYLTAEALSGFISGIMMDENTNLLDVIQKRLKWESDFKSKAMENCKDLNQK